jgi:hypothetical protein
MAFAIMGGLLVATLLTLIFLPALYVAWFRIREPAGHYEMIASSTAADARLPTETWRSQLAAWNLRGVRWPGRPKRRSS